MSARWLATVQLIEVGVVAVGRIDVVGTNLSLLPALLGQSLQSNTAVEQELA